MTNEDELAKAWPLAKPHLEAGIAVARHVYGIEDLFRGVLEGRFQLWIGSQSAALSEVIKYPSKLSLSVFIGGGHLPELQYACKVVEGYARHFGFDMMEVHGRRGYIRRLEGFKEVCTVVSMDFNETRDES